MCTHCCIVNLITCNYWISNKTFNAFTVCQSFVNLTIFVILASTSAIIAGISLFASRCVVDFLQSYWLSLFHFCLELCFLPSTYICNHMRYGFASVSNIVLFFFRHSLRPWNFTSHLIHISLCPLVSGQQDFHLWDNRTTYVLGLPFLYLFSHPIHLSLTQLLSCFSFWVMVFPCHSLRCRILFQHLQ